MIGKLNSDSKEITIIGGGIAGLLAAYRFMKKSYTVILYEQSNRLGGLIKTQKTEFGIVEHAAHSLFATLPVKKLAQQLQIELLSLKPQAKKKYIYRQGHLKTFPLTSIEVVKTLCKILKKNNVSQNLNMQEFGEKFLGQALTNYILDPMITGTYGCLPSELSQQAAFKNLTIRKGERFITVLLKEIKMRDSSSAQIVAPEQGMQEFIDKITRQLLKSKNVKIYLNHNLIDLPPSPNLLFCTPAYVTAKLMEKNYSELAQSLKHIRYVPLISATVFFPDNAFKHYKEGIGVLFPHCEKKDLLGILFTSDSFNHRVTNNKSKSFTIMMGGTQKPAQLDLSDEHIKATITATLDELFGLSKEPSYCAIHRIPHAIPVYNHELFSALISARQYLEVHPGKLLFGNYSGAISIRGMIEKLASL